MNPGARAQAAIAILSDILGHHRPALAALRDWGRAHRFAGSADRAAIGNIVLDALRKRASLSWRMEDDSPRALVLGWLAFVAGHAVEDIARMSALPHALAPLTEEERRRLARPRALREAPAWVRGDYPEWLHEAFTRAFGDTAAEEGAALATRAPLDIRANALKTTREKLARHLARRQPAATPFSPWGLRFHENAQGRLPNVEAEPAFQRGAFDIQDEGSQIAALLSGARPGWQVLDYCAGGGGKTLALAAMMENTGQIHAHDADTARLAAIVPRLKRAGVRNAQLIRPHEKERLNRLEGRMDLVLVDAPCTGTGTWRRRPDAKWRLKPQAVELHVAAQRAILARAASYVRPGGLLAYVTCSVLPAENAGQARAFLSAHKHFTALDWRAHAHLLAAAPEALEAPGAPEVRDVPGTSADMPFLQLTPRRHGTDGFFIALFRRADD